MSHRYDTPPTEVLLPALRNGRLRRAEVTGGAPPTTYYGVPTVKRPTWRWFIPLYFFLGGIASGVSFIGALAELFGGREHRSTVRHARYLAVVLAVVYPILLILDLGRPRRFLHMLRMVKLSSPLNLGTWILSAFGILSGMQAARQAAEDGFTLKRRSLLGRLATALPSGPITVLQGLFGMALGGYTGTVLAATAIPLWASAGVLLGPLFLAASATSGAAALVLTGVLSGRQSREARRDIQVVANMATAVQFGLAAAREALTPDRVSQPLRRGLWGWLFRFGAGGGLLLPTALRWLGWISGPARERMLSLAAAVSTLLGTLAERVAIVEAGKRSADDPLAYQEMTAGLPGEARALPLEQARRPRSIEAPERLGIAARDTAPHAR